jgi:hypothetical protein
MEDLGMDGKIILKWILKLGCYVLDLSSLVQGPLTCSCERSIEPLGSTNGGIS